MKKFTTAEIRDLLNQVYREEISFPRMVEFMNRRVSEAEDIPEEPKNGDLAIFWDNRKECAIIRVYKQFRMGSPFPHQDYMESSWKNAIKFESKEQYERFIKGEI